MQYYQNIKQNKNKFIYWESATLLKQLCLIITSNTDRRETFLFKEIGCQKGFEHLGKIT